ncbi:MAG TPA: S8 family serine peptidase [Candidatus Deferrimicrobiaceae bacterium]
MNSRMKIVTIGLAAVFGLTSLSGVSVSPDRGRLAPALTHAIDETAPDATGIQRLLSIFRGQQAHSLLISTDDEAGLGDRMAALGAVTERLPGGFFVGAVPIETIRYISNWPSIKYIEPSRRVRAMLDTSRPAVLADLVQNGTGAGLSGIPYKGKNSLVAILDSGLYGSHLDFFDNGALALPRVNAFMGYNGAANAAIDTEGHGTHVAGIAAGNGFSSGGLYTGMAPAARLLIYQTSFATADILSGLNQIFAAAGASPVSVNMSLGLMEGPHDGSSLFESAVDGLAAGPAGSKRVVSVAAGNEADMKEHFQATIPALGGTASLGVLVPVPPSGVLPGAIDLWADGSPDPSRQAEHDEYQVVVTGPSVSLTVPSGSTANTPGGSLTVSNRVDTSVPNGATHISILPSASLEGQSISIVLTRTRAGGNGIIDGYLDAYAVTEGFFPSTAGGTIIEPANGNNVLSVGASVTRTTPAFWGAIGGLALFSSQGPTRDARTKPDLAAPGANIYSARSRNATGLTIVTANDNYAIMSGTSMATPHITGIAALAWEANPTLSGAQMRERIRNSADGMGAVPNDSWGYGKANALKAVSATVAAISAPKVVPTGSPVTLDSSNSSGSFGAPLNLAWSLSSRPAGSAASLSGSSPSVSFIPDVPGDYAVSLTASQSAPAGISPATAVRTIHANRLPTTPVITGPASSPTSGPVAFSATSTDPEGAPLTWNWLLVSRPAGSLATLSGSGSAATLSPDVSGSYLVGVRAFDGTDNSILAVHDYAAGVATSPPASSSGGGGCGVPSRGPGNGAADGLMILAAILFVRVTSRRESSRP